MNEQLLKFLDGDETLYPRELEQHFPRILNQIAELWNTPDMEAYFQELMLGKRGETRQGFQTDIASEIFTLYGVYTKQHFRPDTNVWSDVPDLKRQELEYLGYDLSPKGFSKAVEAGSDAAVRLFLSFGVDVNVRDERDWTPLMSASFNGNEEMAALLIRCGAKIHAEDRTGYTSLHWAAFNGHTAVVKMLIAKGANVDARSQFGWTPLMQASTRGHVKVVEILLARGTAVNDRTQDGWTALHKAAANGHAEIVMMLLDKGADLTIEYPDGSTAYSLADKNGHVKIARILSIYRNKI